MNRPRLQKRVVRINPAYAPPQPMDQRATAEIVRRVNTRIEREVEAMIRAPADDRLTRPAPAYPWWMTRH